MKKVIISGLLLIGLIFPSGVSFAQEVRFEILPESESNASDQELNEVIKEIGKTWGLVNDSYTVQASKMEVGDQIKTGIMTRDTLINYLVYIVKYLSQLGMFIGAIMLIYAGYLYATQVFWWQLNKAKDAIKYAFIGIFVITFSYAIMKFFTSMFLGT